jgi:hypothetical protein
MKSEQMRSTLAALAEAFTLAGSTNVAHGLSQLAGLFEGVGRVTVPTLVKTIEVNWKDSERSPRYPKEMKGILEKLKAAFFASAAQTQTKDFAALLRLFSGTPDQSIDTFVLEAHSAAVAPKRKRASLSPKKRPQNLSMDDVSLMAKRLIGLKPDRMGFDALIEKCGNEITAMSLIAVATQFLGHEPSAKKRKADVIAAMRRRQRQDELESDRAGAQSKIRP